MVIRPGPFVHHSALLDELEAVLPSCSSLQCVVVGDANVNLLAENRCTQYDAIRSSLHMICIIR